MHRQLSMHGVGSRACRSHCRWSRPTREDVARPSRGGRPVSRPLVATATGGCCAPVTGGVLAVEDAQQLARMFKALGDPTRVRLLSMITAQSGGEACVCNLTEPVGLSQPTVSHHMKQ